MDIMSTQSGDEESERGLASPLLASCFAEKSPREVFAGFDEIIYPISLPVSPEFHR